MTLKELEAALVLAEEINRLQSRLDTLRETGGVGAVGADAPVRGGPGAVSPGQIAQEIEDEISGLKTQWEIEREIIRRYIIKVDLEAIECKVMLLRYVECLPFKPIQKRIGYERTQTFDYHKSALKKCGLHRTSPDLNTLCQDAKMLV